MNFNYKSYLLTRTLLVLSIFIFTSIPSSYAGNFSFDEEFSLAQDREIPLKQLIPGTEDYFYYNSLHLQNNGEFAKVEDLIKQWIKRYSYSSRLEEIRNRQALLQYENNPSQTIEFIKSELGLQFNHQKKRLKRDVTYPTRLQDSIISFDTLKNIAFRRRNDLSDVETFALEKLLDTQINADRRRNLLNSMIRPEGKNLVDQIISDLGHKYSRGFGSLKIHNNLLLSQLEELRRKMPLIINQNNYVEAVLKRLRPSDDENWQYEPEVKEAFIGRIWAFAEQLPPTFNSLKANILFHKIDFNQKQGRYDKADFLKYIKLPRNASYANRKYNKLRQNRNHMVRLNANNVSSILMPPAGNDETLVRNQLEYFMLQSKSFSDFERYIDYDYLKKYFAETMITNGIGDLEQWYSMLSPQAVKELREKISLSFSPTCKDRFSNDEIVSLSLNLKNVKSLIVKVYELNVFNYYNEHKKEISTALDLDGLVANFENKYSYTKPDYLSHNESFKFPEIKQNGAYIIEIIGNGKSSRALIRKGSLSFQTRDSSAGQVFTIFNENQMQVKNATIWLAGVEYKSDKHGFITLPYSNTPGKKKIIIRQGSFASLHSFTNKSENYQLNGGFFVDRESLIVGKKAKLIFRPQLYVNNSKIDISYLKDASLAINSTDINGVNSNKIVKDIKLQNNLEFTYEFKVPENLQALSFTVNGTIKNLSQSKKQDVSTTKAFIINSIDKTDKIDSFHVRQSNNEYIVELLGKTGEPRPDVAVNIQIKSKYFKRLVHKTLQTDASGRIYLGMLKNISSVILSGPNNTNKKFSPIKPQHTYNNTLHGKSGNTILVPIMCDIDQEKSDIFSFYELRNGTYVNDLRDKISIQNGYLKINNIPAGNYELFIKDIQKAILVKLANGKRVANLIISKKRCLDLTSPRPLQIGEIKTEKEQKQLIIKLKNVSPTTRVHIIKTRYLPKFSAYSALGNFIDSEPSSFEITPPLCRYLSGRKIGDEYRYILERKYARIFPGNMLKRPSLLLNAWSIRKTDTGTQEAASGDKWQGLNEGSGRGSASGGNYPNKSSIAPQSTDYTNLNFLPEISFVSTNLIPNAESQVVVDLSKLPSGQLIHVLAVDKRSGSFRSYSLPEVEENYLDIRMAKSLAPTKHFSEQKSISIKQTGQSLVIQDASTSKIESFDTLASVYQLLLTLNNNSHLKEFNFILKWPDLNDNEKLEHYSKHSCHELNFFIYKKDNAFFTSIIKPYLVNKRDKTFLDNWLIGADLSEYLKPWQFSRLNIVERILLAQKTSNKAATQRHINDMFNLIAPDIQQTNYLFKTALKGSSLETGDKFGLDALEKQVRLIKRPTAPSGISIGDSFSGGFGGKDQSMAFESSKVSMPPVRRRLSKKSTRRRPSSSKSFKLMAQKEESFADMDNEILADEADSNRRDNIRQYFRQLDKTEEWVENNYYKLPIEQQIGTLIPINAFWDDFATNASNKPFYSENFARAASNFTEMMFALSVLDLPFKANKHETSFKGNVMTLKATSPAIVFHKEIKVAKESAKINEILTGQNFFAKNDRYFHERNERFDKFVTDEFLTWRVYGCQVVLTNPTSSNKKVDVLLQIPAGAIPVQSGFYTKSIHMQLSPFSTKKQEYFFYFPSTGTYKHYPVHVSENEEMIASTKPFVFKVVNELTKLDKTSWPYISQHGSSNDVLEFLQKENVERLDLEQIAFRMKDNNFFKKVIKLLKARHHYNQTLWSYSLFQKDLPAIKDFLPYTSIANQCGISLYSKVLTVDPVERHTYQHKEYWPLVNARVYPLGKKTEILNKQFANQYGQLLENLKYHKTLTDNDMLAIVYYLLLQERFEEANSFFNRVTEAKAKSSIQYKYMAAYLAFSFENLDKAVEIAQNHKNYPVIKWRNLFLDILGQAKEVNGAKSTVIDDENRSQLQNKLAETQPEFEFTIVDNKIDLRYQNVKELSVSYYLMDLELLFSRKPFVQEISGQFSIIKPNLSKTIKLNTDADKMKIEIPDLFKDQNVMVEISGSGRLVSKAHYPHSLRVQMMENYGITKVSHKSTGKPISKVYVKVYCRQKNGSIVFYKDGYTDLRGKFDYASLSTNKLDSVQEFSILIMSEKNGSIVKEVSPPAR